MGVVNYYHYSVYKLLVVNLTIRFANAAAAEKKSRCRPHAFASIAEPALTLLPNPVDRQAGPTGRKKIFRRRSSCRPGPLYGAETAAGHLKTPVLQDTPRRLWINPCISTGSNVRNCPACPRLDFCPVNVLARNKACPATPNARKPLSL